VSGQANRRLGVVPRQSRGLLQPQHRGRLQRLQGQVRRGPPYSRSFGIAWRACRQAMAPPSQQIRLTAGPGRNAQRSEEGPGPISGSIGIASASPSGNTLRPSLGFTCQWNRYLATRGIMKLGELRPRPGAFNQGALRTTGAQQITTCPARELRRHICREIRRI